MQKDGTPDKCVDCPHYKKDCCILAFKKYLKEWLEEEFPEGKT